MPTNSCSLRRFSRPRTPAAEIDLKLRRYREAPQNLYVLAIEPREFRVEIHAKSRNWQQPALLTQPDDRIAMAELELDCAVGDLYRGTPLDPQSRRTT